MQKRRRIRAIERPMIERLRQHPHRPNSNSIAIGLFHHHRLFAHAVDRQNRRLRRINDRRGNQRAIYTGIGKRVGPLGKVVGFEFVRPR